jgi:hypothetical protein
MRRVILEVYDESGRLRGCFQRAVPGAFSDDAKIAFTDEALAKREQEPGGRSLTEIMAHLGAKEPLFTDEEIQHAEKQIHEGTFFTTAEVLARLK